MTENYTERLDGPDGQYVVLLTRLPYDRHQRIESAAVNSKNMSDFFNAVLHAMVWEASVQDYLEGKDAGDDVDRADPALVMKWRERAVELYYEWQKVALPAPKGRTRRPAK